MMEARAVLGGVMSTTLLGILTLVPLGEDLVLQIALDEFELDRVAIYRIERGGG